MARNGSVRSRRSRLRLWLAALATFVVAVAGCLVTASPALASPAPPGPWPLLVTNEGSGTVTDIGPTWDVTLTVDSAPRQVAITPDGKYAYVTNYDSGTNYGSGTVSVIDNADTANPTVSATILTVGSGPRGVAVVPDQAPVASLSATPAPAGSPTTFDATGSTVAYGTITSYSWNFGDGTPTVTTATPTTTHTYTSVGTYTATASKTLTVPGGFSVPTITATTTSVTSSDPSVTTGRAVTETVTAPKIPQPLPGYWLAGSDGAVHAFGGAPTESPASVQTGGAVVGMAAAPDGGGVLDGDRRRGRLRLWKRGHRGYER